MGLPILASGLPETPRRRSVCYVLGGRRIQTPRGSQDAHGLGISAGRSRRHSGISFWHTVKTSLPLVPLLLQREVLASPHVRQVGRAACLRAMGRPGDSSVSVPVGDSRHDMMPPLVRHLDHHHYKWASTKAVVMDADLQTAVAAATVHSTSRGGHSSDTPSRCRARAPVGGEPGAEMGRIDALNQRAMALTFARAVCADGDGARVPWSN